jgi:hypothetical protein
MGGLGNQMFQYAAAKSLALKLNCKLYLDTDFFYKTEKNSNYTQREYQLNIFPIDEIIINKTYKKIFILFYYITNSSLYSFINQYIFRNKLIHFNIYYDHEPGYKKDFFLNSKYTYLDGYFQSSEYFSQYFLEIRKIFTLHNVKDKSLSNEYKKLINIDNPIFVHIRRGDYISNMIINEVHGICNEKYYYDAFQIIKNRLHNPVFYIFSDNPEDAIKLLDPIKYLYNIKYVSLNNSLQEFDLMICCKHAIIANSSFSWWASWLINNENKIIIAPKQWFANNDLNNKIYKLIPDNWIKI